MEKFEDNPRLIAGFLIHEISRYSQTIFDRKVKHLGLTRSQWWILSLLYRSEGLTQNNLAEILTVGKGSIVAAIDRMEKAGFVERRKNSNDRRSNLIFLTEKSHSLVDKLMKISNDFANDSMGFISDSDLKVLMRLLQNMKENLNRMNQSKP